MKITEKDFLQAVERADRRYFDMVTRRIERHRSETAARKGQCLMKQRETRGKIGRIGKIAAAGLIAAAVLGAGGMAAIVAMRGTQGGNNQSEDSSGAVQFTLHLTEDDGTEPVTTIFANSPNTHGLEDIAETAEGWYYLARKQELLYDTTSDGFPSGGGEEHEYFCFKSKETGEVIPLCARPNCLHDGNEFCEASTNVYQGGTGLIEEGGRLYRIADRVTEGADSKADGTYILSYAPDGTGIEELVKLSDRYYGTHCKYRGYLFFTELVYTEFSNAETQVTYRQEGWRLCCYEFATGKAYSLCAHLPEGQKTAYYSVPVQMFGIGDDLYLYSRRGNNKETGMGLFRFDLNTMELEQIDQGANIETERVGAARDAIYYVNRVGTQSVGMRYDCKTHECTEGLSEVRESWNDAAQAFPQILREGSYTLWENESFNKETCRPEHLIVLGDKEGHELARADLKPMGEMEYFTVRDGYLYVRTYGRKMIVSESWDESGFSPELSWNPDADLNSYLLRVSLSDFAAGRTNPMEWEKLLTISDVTAKETYLDWAHEDG